MILWKGEDGGKEERERGVKGVVGFDVKERGMIRSWL
jgi:hypothetical protein